MPALIPASSPPAARDRAVARGGLFLLFVGFLVSGFGGVALGDRGSPPPPVTASASEPGRGTPPAGASAGAPKAAGQAAAPPTDPRERMAEARLDMLDALADEHALSDAQYERLAAALEAELEEGAALMDARRRASTGPPPPVGDLAARMAAVKARADAEAHEVLTPEQFAAWEAMRRPAPGFGAPPARPPATE